ncbi:hypothetical protein SERLA73DRAFT_162366 [Serpula lacrymans var. lacrymans S7.3]|uniref:Cellobiose dehydrogenase-like cytochrome domain-containing protein n=2 Tax=Serpula lacrymans var. lacrymans TaxID=341189 RepID=F8Q7I1_SERL3|nr:cytochrome b562 [Serpula lacrymans var. lacrymans S7.9]EGN95519.1 hypothetical protein SERLA73DRAFT_162366 [Serpula lacrymans var. lacrymans S7.3]EGO21046.1 cytochrome b562 [Serpula lacrymans var. lacrymans S7.9]
MFQKLLVASLLFLGIQFVNAVPNATAYCDSTSGICYQGYTDPTLDITVGLTFPPVSTDGGANSTAFIAEIVAPVTYGWTGITVGGSMAYSLLFVLWPYEGEVILSPRWTTGYTQPTPYYGPIITMLPGTSVNSTSITASFLCENCTYWEGGAIGGGDLEGTQLIEYVANNDTEVFDPANYASNFTIHDVYGSFELNLADAHFSDFFSLL